MANNKWEDVLADRTQYPDDAVFKLSDGTEVKLGDVRPSHMKDADYRQKTSELARRRDAFETEANQRMKAIQEGEAQLMQIAQELVKQNPGMTKKEVTEEYDTDPAVQKLRAEITEMKQFMKPLADAVVDLDTRAKNARQAYVVSEHRKALADLKAKDPELDEQRLIDYAKAEYVPNLRHAYDLMNRDKIIESKVKEAKEAAYNEAFKKAKDESLAAPMIPLRSIAARAEDAPKTWRAVMDKALVDPEIMNPLMGRTQ